MPINEEPLHASASRTQGKIILYISLNSRGACAYEARGPVRRVFQEPPCFDRNFVDTSTCGVMEAVVRLAVGLSQHPRKRVRLQRVSEFNYQPVQIVLNKHKTTKLFSHIKAWYIIV